MLRSRLSIPDSCFAYTWHPLPPGLCTAEYLSTPTLPRRQLLHTHSSLIYRRSNRLLSAECIAIFPSISRASLNRVKFPQGGLYVRVELYPPSVDYPGTRRVEPGPVATRSGTAIGPITRRLFCRTRSTRRLLVRFSFPILSSAPFSFSLSLLVATQTRGGKASSPSPPPHYHCRPCLYLYCGNTSAISSFVDSRIFHYYGGP